MANLVFDNLTTYIEQRRLPIYSEALLKGKSASLFTLQSDIKTSAVVNLLKTDIAFGDGATCGFEPAGSQTLSQRVINTGLIKVNMEYCEKEFLKYWTQYDVRVQAGQETLPFEEYFVNGILKGIEAGVEKLLWQGDKASEDDNLNKADGLIKILGAEADVIKPTVASGASAYDAIKAVYLAIPEAILDKAVVMVGADVFRQYMQEMVEKNFYHYSADGMPSEEFIIPGTTTKVVALNGLNGTNKIVAGALDNIFYGCDLADADKKIEAWYSKDFRTYRVAVEFNVGTQVAFPSQVVMATLA